MLYWLKWGRNQPPDDSVSGWWLVAVYLERSGGLRLVETFFDVAPLRLLGNPKRPPVPKRHVNRVFANAAPTMPKETGLLLSTPKKLRTISRLPSFHFCPRVGEIHPLATSLNGIRRVFAQKPT